MNGCLYVIPPQASAKPLACVNTTKCLLIGNVGLHLMESICYETGCIIFCKQSRHCVVLRHGLQLYKGAYLSMYI